MSNRNFSAFWFAALLGAVSFSFTGCGKPAAPPAAGGGADEHAHEEGDEHAGHAHAEGEAHGHGTTGPHGGALIELGTEDYHAELVHDEATESIVVYLLDGGAKTSVAIDAPELLINLTHEGKGEQFKLTAAPDAGDAAGKSSRFTSNDGELIGDLDHEHAKAELVAEIEGKQYRGVVEHHDDHDESAHKHE